MRKMMMTLVEAEKTGYSYGLTEWRDVRGGVKTRIGKKYHFVRYLEWCKNFVKTWRSRNRKDGRDAVVVTDGVRCCVAVNFFPGYDGQRESLYALKGNGARA